MKLPIVIGIAISVFLFETAEMRADGCPKRGASAWCCSLEDPDPSKSPQSYRWHEDMQLCAGLISPKHSVTNLALVSYLLDPVPTDKELQTLSKPLEISTPAPSVALDGAILFKGSSLKGGRYFIAGDITDRTPREWVITDFRQYSALSASGFVAYRPQEVATQRPTVYLPIRLALPSGANGGGTSARVQLLSSETIGKSQATFRTLDKDLKLTANAQEIGLVSKALSAEVVEVTIPNNMPAAFELILRACKASDSACDAASAAPVRFNLLASP
ncbi:hypothetical protein [Ensifer aridi]|uniref:hypothetical protein n=1 Tax=Ensifer aridi TaxID=1708715 RepID=UPI00111C75B9|nr:hypothetical protein [Ensifer aridi]